MSWAGHDECMQPCGSEGQVLSTYSAIFLVATLSFWDPVPNSHQFFFFFFLLGVKFCTIVNSFLLEKN